MKEKIDNLFYHRNITNILQEFSRRDVDKINEELVMEVVEEATVSLSAKEKIEAANLATVEGRLFDAKNETEVKEQEHNNQLIAIKKGLRQKAYRNAKIWATLIITIITIEILLSEVFLLFSFFIGLTQIYKDFLTIIYSGGIGLPIVGGTIWIAKIARIKLIQHIGKGLYKSLLEEIMLSSTSPK